MVKKIVLSEPQSALLQRIEQLLRFEEYIVSRKVVLNKLEEYGHR